MKCTALLLLLVLAVAACAPDGKHGTAGATGNAPTFADDVAFLSTHIETIVLNDHGGKARVAVVPAYQGRVMTSTGGGPGGISYGWINRELIASGKTVAHMNPFGGEDRFWLGPEGGQYAIFFAKDAPFDFDHWQTPASIDTDAYTVVSRSDRAVSFRRAFGLTNYGGFRFRVRIDREIRLLDAAGAWNHLGADPAAGLEMVAYESVNRITNAGEKPWKKETGLLSVWILGMYTPSDATTIVIPVVPGPESARGPKVIDDYFGKVPPERLVVGEKTVFFRGDGKCRSKIGIRPARCRGVLGSYDAADRALTVVQFTFDPAAKDYVNSLWKIQEKPYAGDAANSYNDGPPKPGAKPMGPFYELESSSPAAALAPGGSLVHVHRTIHLRGPEKQLDPVCRAVLGVSIADITAVFGGGKQ